MRCLASPLLLVFSLWASQAAAASGHRATEPINSIADLVLPYGYPLEEHAVQTEDGYIVTLFRIPHGRHASGGTGGAQERTAATHDSTQLTLDPHHTQQPTGDTTSSTGLGWSRKQLHHSSLGEAAGQKLAASPRPVVYLQHGLLDSCAGFLLQGPGSALGFLLADAGFDVWLGNSRGSTQSRAHAWLSPESAEYWAFSFDEMAQYDLPASLAYVLSHTRQPRTSFVSHSQGGTILLAALASRPALADQLGLMMLMAPVATAHHASSVPLQAMAALGTDGMFTLLGVHEFMPSVRLISWLEGQLCVVQPALCISILAAICGYRQDMVNTTRLPLYLQYTPAGSSVQNMAHWAQNVRGGSSPGRPQLAYFDYGTFCEPFVATDTAAAGDGAADNITAGDNIAAGAEAVADNEAAVDAATGGGAAAAAAGSGGGGRSAGASTARVRGSARSKCNQEEYGSWDPPVYQLSNIPAHARMVIFTGGQDRLADPIDVELMLEQIPEGVVVQHHYDPDLEHLDYIWGYDSARRVYAKVVDGLLASWQGAAAEQ